MYEAKYRGKRLDNHEWVFGHYLFDGVTGQAFIFASGNFVNESDKVGEEVCLRFFAFEVDPETVCWFTGISTKSGQDVYEGDIIKHHFGKHYAPILYGAYQSCFDSRKTEHIGFYVDWEEDCYSRKDLGYWIHMVDAEVVGNVFDHLELLGRAT